jgi:CheY-like chemotaxis protein
MDNGKKLSSSAMERILIVEDNAFFLQFLKETLHSRFPSTDIQEAVDAKEAMQKLKNFSPGTIFVDLRLPGENGIELTKKIKAEYPDTIVVILTNYDLPEYREAAYQSKADHFVTKDSFLKMIKSIQPKQNTDPNDSGGRKLN